MNTKEWCGGFTKWQPIQPELLVNKAKWIRCPRCNRRLKMKSYNCHELKDPPCIHFGIPAHKPKGKNRKLRKQSRDKRRPD